MRFFRNSRWLEVASTSLVVAVAATALGMAACKKKEKGGDSKTGGAAMDSKGPMEAMDRSAPTPPRRRVAPRHLRFKAFFEGPYAEAYRNAEKALKAVDRAALAKYDTPLGMVYDNMVSSLRTAKSKQFELYNSTNPNTWLSANDGYFAVQSTTPFPPALVSDLKGRIARFEREKKTAEAAKAKALIARIETLDAALDTLAGAAMKVYLVFRDDPDANLRKTAFKFAAKNLGYAKKRLHKRLEAVLTALYRAETSPEVRKAMEADWAPAKQLAK